MSSPRLADLPPPPAGRTGWPWTTESALLPERRADGSPWPRVSIVTPSYNQGPFLEETIRSVLLQGYPNLEYIVMDGGSTDESVGVLRRYGPWLAHWVSRPDSGQADAINKGLRQTSGRILAYLNSDDLYLPNALATVAEYFVTNTEVGLLYGECQVIDTKSHVLGRLPIQPTTVEQMIHQGNYLPQPATFWRSRVTEKVGLFDASLQFVMDFDYFIRIACEFPLAYLPIPLAAFRRHQVSKTVSQEEKHWREALLVSERYGMKPWTPWYWIRRVRHHALRHLPPGLQSWIHRRLGRVMEG
ncbi:MAG: glycosyltransferase [Ardenticatenales bacterium]|nr:glycosyltransferase [Ardenticatenales bacterium]